jgi:hypothetical protein
VLPFPLCFWFSLPQGVPLLLRGGKKKVPQAFFSYLACFTYFLEEPGTLRLAFLFSAYLLFLCIWESLPMLGREPFAENESDFGLASPSILFWPLKEVVRYGLIRDSRQDLERLVGRIA